LQLIIHKNNKIIKKIKKNYILCKLNSITFKSYIGNFTFIPEFIHSNNLKKNKKTLPKKEQKCYCQMAHSISMTTYLDSLVQPGLNFSIQPTDMKLLQDLTLCLPFLSYRGKTVFA